MTLLHLDYTSSPYWLSKVNRSMITVPEWVPLDQLHPEDFQVRRLLSLLVSRCHGVLSGRDEKEHGRQRLLQRYVQGERHATMDAWGWRWLLGRSSLLARRWMFANITTP